MPWQKCHKAWNKLSDSDRERYLRIGNNLRTCRKKCGKTQSQVAFESYISTTAYQKYEWGAMMPRSKNTRDAIKVALEAENMDIFEESEEWSDG